MRRRSKGLSAPSGPDYSAAQVEITRLEARVVYTMVQSDFTFQDVCEVLWPVEVREPLTRAYPLIKAGDRSDYIEFSGNVGDQIQLLAPAGTRINRVTAKVTQFGMLCPNSDAIRVDVMHPAFGRLRGAIDATWEIVQRFNELRRVVHWFQDKRVTAGAARYYFPAITALLPAAHPVQQSDGVRFKEGSYDVAPMVPLFRECAGTVAEALMCTQEPPKKLGLFTLSFKSDVARHGDSNDTQIFSFI